LNAGRASLDADTIPETCTGTEMTSLLTATTFTGIEVSGAGLLLSALWSFLPQAAKINKESTRETW
jgi:hypothetical protein